MYGWHEVTSDVAQGIRRRLAPPAGEDSQDRGAQHASHLRSVGTGTGHRCNLAQGVEGEQLSQRGEPLGGAQRILINPANVRTETAWLGASAGLFSDSPKG